MRVLSTTHWSGARCKYRMSANLLENIAHWTHGRHSVAEVAAMLVNGERVITDGATFRRCL